MNDAIPVLGPRVFRWENVPHRSRNTAQVCDIEGHRLYVRRKDKLSRTFVGIVDNTVVYSERSSIDEMKRMLENHFNKTYTAKETSNGA